MLGFRVCGIVCDEEPVVSKQEKSWATTGRLPIHSSLTRDDWRCPMLVTAY